MCSENKGADQLRGYREADLRLCFRICKTLIFSRSGSIVLLAAASKGNIASAIIISKQTRCYFQMAKS